MNGDLKPSQGEAKDYVFLSFRTNPDEHRGEEKSRGVNKLSPKRDLSGARSLRRTCFFEMTVEIFYFSMLHSLCLQSAKSGCCDDFQLFHCPLPIAPCFGFR